MKDNLNNWIEISQSAYRNNLKFFKTLLDKRTEFSVVVKSNAYGHGMKEISRLAVKFGADSFCVHTLDEALELRREGFTCDILIMGPVLLNRLSEVIKHDLRLVVYNLETIHHLKKLTTRLKTSGADSSQTGDWHLSPGNPESRFTLLPF